MTVLACLTSACGLSLRETSDFLKTPLDTVKSWSSGRNPTPPSIIEELKTLWKQMFNASLQEAKKIDDTGAKEVELGLASDDQEARQLGLPCVGAHRAMLGMTAALSDAAIRIVPRGSTAASVAATDTHE